MADTILIIDFGSQVTQLIARRLRETGVYTEILPCTTDPEKIAAAVPNGIILSGGPNSVALADTPRVRLLKMRRATITGCSFIPRWCIPRAVQICCNNLRLVFAAAAAAGRWPPIASGRLPLFASRSENRG